MADRRTNFLVTLVFDENLHIGEQIDTECSFKNEITKDLQHLIKGKAIKHFVIADDEVINDKLKEEPKTGHWIEDAKTYYEELNKRGLGVDEYTPYFTDDIACSECLAKYSMLDNETQFFKHCPNCGAKMEGVEE